MNPDVSVQTLVSIFTTKLSLGRFRNYIPTFVFFGLTLLLCASTDDCVEKIGLLSARRLHKNIKYLPTKKVSCF